MDTVEKIFIVIAIGLLVFGVVAIVFSGDGQSEAHQYCSEWGGEAILRDVGRLFVWGDWTAVCIDRNPDRILYISGQ